MPKHASAVAPTTTTPTTTASGRDQKTFSLCSSCFSIFASLCHDADRKRQIERKPAPLDNESGQDNRNEEHHNRPHLQHLPPCPDVSFHASRIGIVLVVGVGVGVGVAAALATTAA